MEQKMKLGILGTGMIVREFLPWLAGPESPFAVQAVCSTPRSEPLAAELCAQYGVPQHTTNYLELLQWVDVVYLAVPNIQHARYAKVALEAGRHVIVEKPMTPTAAQTEELAALARHKKVFLFEAMTTQYLENYSKIRELLPRIGTVKLVQCNFSQYSSRYDAFCAGNVAPSFDPKCAGGALMDLNVYNISYIVGLFGEPNRAVYAANMDQGHRHQRHTHHGLQRLQGREHGGEGLRCPRPVRHPGHQGLYSAKIHCQLLRRRHPPPQRGKGGAFQLEWGPSPAGGGVRRLCAGHRGRRSGAVQPDAGHLRGRQPGADGGKTLGRHPLPL